MAFGNYKIKADFGGERITDRNSATAFILTLTAIYRNKAHWKLAGSRQPRAIFDLKRRVISARTRKGAETVFF
jgi:hypothetical protein